MIKMINKQNNQKLNKIINLKLSKNLHYNQLKVNLLIFITITSNKDRYGNPNKNIKKYKW